MQKYNLHFYFKRFLYDRDLPHFRASDRSVHARLEFGKVFARLSFLHMLL